MAFDDMDSTLNVQQYIQQTIQQNPADIDVILTPPPDLDDGVWKYEHLRQFCLQLNGLAFMLQVMISDWFRSLALLTFL
ncbi:unnamed protein product [Strongylus vulgaris]|uniref:Uncharacterized protein n=1 Tax=Strongylus vulgaris TaxID=40348 RepID=A0A3P7JGS3_STRVU|nr:unnamed protein product [Strongylus vulgaris]